MNVPLVADSRRDLLLELFRVALAAVDGRKRVRAALAGREGQGPVSAFAVGKAAAAMMLGATDALGARLERGLVVAPDGAVPAALASRRGMVAIEAGHPRPDARSLAAGQALLDFAAATPPGSRVLLLVSGGASALLEVPLPGVALEQLVQLFERSLREGLDIERLNRERIALSRVKGGQLAPLFDGALIEALMISDVPRDDVAVLGSGLLDTAGLDRRLVGSIDEALDAVLLAATQRGLKAVRGRARLAGDAEEVARRICHELATSGADLHVHGGETVVHLPEHPGRGGRCQHLAVAAARQIAGHADLMLLAAGTDGRDGSSEDAGAIVDGGTLSRAAACGMDADSALAAADTGTLLEACGDLVYTGPTGTNVGDIVLALRQAPPESGRM